MTKKFEIDSLKQLSVVDFGLGMAGGLIGKLLCELGITTFRVEPEEGDPFYKVYTAYTIWQQYKTITQANDISSAIEKMDEKLRKADFCIIGGEDYPNLNWRPDAETLQKRYPKLIILDITGSSYGLQDSNLPAVDLLVQANTGLVFEQLDDKPSVFALPAGAYGASLHGLVGLFSALCERERSGHGQIVRTSLVEGVLGWLIHDWYRFEKPTPVANDVTPKAAIPLIFECGDGKYLHFIMASTDARKNVFTLLGVENPVPSLEEDPRGMPSNTREPRYYYDNVDMLRPHFKKWKRDELLEALWAKNVSAEAVNDPGEPWSDEQVLYNKLITTSDTGFRYVGFPFNMSFGEKEEAHEQPSETVVHAPPLKGLRVIDFGTFAAGPFSSEVLNDLGADVIKVESLQGDAMSYYFLKYTSTARGKRVICLDMKNPEGREIAKKLCLSADMVHHNFRPGVTKRLGIDAQRLLDLKPELIILEAAAYGVSGPKAKNAGFDMIFHSYCGHSIRGAGPTGVPRNYRLPVVDFTSGAFGALASAIAYYVKKKEGRGVKISTNLLNAGLYLLSELIQKEDGDFLPLPELNNDLTGFHPAYRIYPVGEEWIAIAALGESMAKRFIQALDLQNEVTSRREDWGDREAKIISDTIKDLNINTLLQTLKESDVWATKCRSDAKESFLSDPLMLKNGGVLMADDPKHGKFWQLGTMINFSRSITVGRGNSPERGGHTREVLNEIGYSDSEIDRLYQKNVIA